MSDTSATEEIQLGTPEAPTEAQEYPQTDADTYAEPSDEAIIQRAQAFLKRCEEAESETRKEALDDIEFSVGKQWPDKIKQDRDVDGRPCLVVNRMPQNIQQVTNDQRQNRPAIKVHPVDDEADIETAKVIQGLTRNIEHISVAEEAYDAAFDSAVRSSFGFFRIATRFASPDSFDQELVILPIKNQFSTHLDPSSQRLDGSDAKEGLIIDYLDEDSYKCEFPGSKLASLGNWDSIGSRAPGWMRGKDAAVAEYFYKYYVPATIHLLSTGETVRDEHLQARLQEARQAGLQVEITKTRKTKIPKVRHCKLNAVEVLEKTDFPSQYIPIIPVYGNCVSFNGKVVRESLIRYAKDPQRMLNYMKSAQTEAIGLAPKAPYIGASGQFEGHEKEWAEANSKNLSYLEYEPISYTTGQPVPPPARQNFEPAVQAITQAVMMSVDDVKATTGLYDPSLGQQKSDQSGVAIQKLNTQAQTSNFHLVDNLKHSIRHGGLILIDAIPNVYDSERAARIVAEDGTHKMVKLNQSYMDQETGEQKLYDVSVGKYDVTVDVGPSYATKRQEAAASMMEFTGHLPPEIASKCVDLIVKEQDWPGSELLSERLRKMLPPQLLDDGKAPKIPPQIQAQLQQMSQHISNLSQMYHQAQDQLDRKIPEIQSRERIDMERIQVDRERIRADLETSLAKLQSDSNTALMKHQIAELMARDELRHEAVLAAQPPQDFSQDSGSQAAGGPPPMAAQGAQPPTGGASPGQSVEGNT